MDHCWDHDPSARPTFDQVCEEIRFTMSDNENGPLANVDSVLTISGSGFSLGTSSTKRFLSTPSSRSSYGSVTNEVSESEFKSDTATPLIGHHDRQSIDESKSELSLSV